MISEECKFLHPAPCKKYMEDPERSCRAQCKGYHPKLYKYSRATRECYNDRCFRIHLKGTRRKQPPRVPGTKYNSTNYKSTTSYDQNTKPGLQPPPTLVNTPHPAYYRHSPCPPHQLITTLHTLCNISPPIRLPFHCTLIPHHSMLSLIQPAHPQPLLNPFVLLKHPHSHHKHIILLFPASSSHLNPTPHISIPRMGTSERHKGAQMRMTIFFYGK